MILECVGTSEHGEQGQKLPPTFRVVEHLLTYLLEYYSLAMAIYEPRRCQNAGFRTWNFKNLPWVILSCPVPN